MTTFDLLQPLPARLDPVETIDLRTNQTINGYLLDYMTQPDGEHVLQVIRWGRGEPRNQGRLVEICGQAWMTTSTVS